MTLRTQKSEEIRQILANDGSVLAFVFKNVIASGVRFLTPPDLPIQVGILDHKNGKEVPMHKHTSLRAQSDATHEWIYVEKGVMEVTVADEAWTEAETVTLEAGDSIMFTAGAHRITFHKDTRAIEIKQGPYPGDAKAKIHRA